MRRLLLPLVALGLVLAGCGDDDGSTTDDTTPPETDLPELVVVFGPDEAETSTNGEEVTWTPDADDVAAVEEILAAHLEAEADQGVEPLETYARQYVGIGADEDLVSVNALCESADLDWEDELILVNDGGPCFWQATVDPATGAVESFTVNGVA